MKSRHIAQAAAATAFLTVAALLGGAEVHVGQPDGLTVHEWGTFTSVAGEDGNSVNWNVLGGKDDLPRFVNDNYHCFKRLLTGSVRMETPVLYFYTASNGSPSACLLPSREHHGMVPSSGPEQRHRVEEPQDRAGHVASLPGRKEPKPLL